MLHSEPFEVVNPNGSNIILFAKDAYVAKMACVVLGRGQYPLRDKDGQEILPVLMYADEEELREMELSPVGPILASRGGEIADCLDSVFYGDSGEFVQFLGELPPEADFKKAVRNWNVYRISDTQNLYVQAKEDAEWVRKKVQSKAKMSA